MILHTPVGETSVLTGGTRKSPGRSIPCRHLRTMVAGAMLLVASGCSPGRPDEGRERLARAPLSVRMAAADAMHGAALFGQCAACHTISRNGPDRDGPNLFGVAGHAIGHGSRRFGYSGALEAVGGSWTIEKLDRWLASPQRFAPGTLMTFPGLANGADRADVIAYLNGKGGSLVLPHASSGRPSAP